MERSPRRVDAAVTAAPTYSGPERRRFINRSWPLPAFAAWAACWIVFASVAQLGAAPAAAFVAAGLVGAALSLIGATPWRRVFVGCGSDHTDRKVEAYSVTVSKQMCDKPVASVLWELEDVIAHWDRLILRSWAVIGGARVLYQEGTLDAMLPVKDLIERGFGGKGLPDGCAMFGGTFAAKGGIRPADRFEFELEDPVLKRKISHGYDVITMPVLG